MLKRKKTRDTSDGMSSAIDLAANRLSGGLKMVPVMGALAPMGDCSTAVNVRVKGALVLFFNPGASAVYISFGPAAVTAPAAGAGSPIPAGQFVVYPATDDYCISSGTCYAYDMIDDSHLSDSGNSSASSTLPPISYA